MANILYAIFWAALATFFFVWKAYSPTHAGPNIPNSNVSMGWVAVALTGYNLMRWWTRRTVYRARLMLESRTKSLRTKNSASAGRAAITDPQFNFDSPPRSENRMPGN